MNFKMFFMLLLGGIMTLSAQNQGSVTGKVIDKTTREPIPYVSIVVKVGDSVATGGITDDKGEFALKNLALKSYTVDMQFMGYKTHTENITLSESEKTANMGTVVLAEDATLLDEVEIIKDVSTIEQKIDRKVITLGRDLTTAGGTAAEIMNNIPSVNVDHNGAISLRGNQNVRILVDGRPTNVDPAQLLKQIPASSIKKIELITNPSAKYNPEGMSGIINIILHKNSNDGFNGSYNGGVNFGITPKFNNSLDMNYRRGKVNFFTNVGGGIADWHNNGRTRRYDENLLQLTEVINSNEGFLGKFGMDYYINDRNTLSAYTTQNIYNGDAVITADIDYPESSEFADIYQYSGFNSYHRNSVYNLAYKHKFEKEGHTLDFEGNFNETNYTQDGDYSTTVGTVNGIYNDRMEDFRQNTTLNLDYVNPLTETSTLELGAEARAIRMDNVYLTTNPDVTNPALQNSTYAYDVDIYSAYATFGQKFGKFSYQLGARFESYKVKANFNKGTATFDDDYLTVYPSAYLTYSLNDNNMLQLSYSRRVDRPSLEQTKPVREFATPLITSYGNPYLEPQFTNSAEFNYTKMLGEGSSVTAGVFYRLINNEINRVVYPDETTASTQDVILSYDNFDNNSAYGFEVSANYKINKWWDIQPAVDFSAVSQKGAISILQPSGDYLPTIKEVDVNVLNARLNSNFKINSRLSFLMFGFYRSPVNGIQNNVEEQYRLDSGARYTLLDNKLSLSVRFNDMFNTMKYAFDAEHPFPHDGVFRWESRMVFVGLNYRFGAGKNRAMQRRQREENTTQGSGGMF